MAVMANNSSSTEIERFTRFALVGLLGTALDFSLLTLLKLAGLSTLLANSLSFTAGLANNFTWNRLWTFQDLPRSDLTRQLSRFMLVSLIGLFFNNLIVLALEGVFQASLGPWSYLPAKLIATAVVVFWNFFANRTWTFKI